MPRRLKAMVGKGLRNVGVLAVFELEHGGTVMSSGDRIILSGDRRAMSALLEKCEGMTLGPLPRAFTMSLNVAMREIGRALGGL